MRKRRLFLLFFAAMSLSIMVMLIVYGLFIKDINFNLNVKNPESAPSPITEDDTRSEDNSPEPALPLAKVQTPEQVANNTAPPLPAGQQNTTAAESKDIVPLESQMARPSAVASPLPEEQEIMPKASTDSQTGEEETPSLHYVYMDGFSTESSAEQAIQQLQDRHLVAQPYVRQYKGEVILQFGVYSDKANAEVLAQQLRHQQVYVKVD